MICIAENSGGKGGIAGGAGANGQGSQSATGAGSSSYGYPVVEVTTGMTTQITVQLTKDYDGTIPADLSDIDKVVLVARPSMVSNEHQFQVDCAFTPEGVVTTTFTPQIVNYRNGVWYTQYHCLDSQGNLKQNYRAYLCIRKGMTGSKNGPHTITAMDVRLALLDTSAQANQLLDDLEFSDVLIYNAIQRSIDEWNQTPPALAQLYTPQTFPYREHLIKGAVGFLMQSVAYRYTRNRMLYSASGLSLDTSDKGPQYIQLAKMARLEWKNFIAAKKTEHNMAECFGIVDLPYFGSRIW